MPQDRAENQSGVLSKLCQELHLGGKNGSAGEEMKITDLERCYRCDDHGFKMGIK